MNGQEFVNTVEDRMQAKGYLFPTEGLVLAHIKNLTPDELSQIVNGTDKETEINPNHRIRHEQADQEKEEEGVGY